MFTGRLFQSERALNIKAFLAVEVNKPVSVYVEVAVPLYTCSLRVLIATSTSMTVAARSTGEAEVIFALTPITPMPY